MAASITNPLICGQIRLQTRFPARALGNSRVRVRVGVRAAAGPVLEKKGAAIGVDVVSEAELKEKGLMGLRKTKLVCTVGPACSSDEGLEKLAIGGMNVARLNMCHNSREWHQRVIRAIRRLNQEKGFCVAVMIDTEGSQMHMVGLGGDSSVKAEVFLFILRI